MKKNIIALFFIFLMAIGFSQDWYVCLGSYSIKRNAEEFKSLLEKEQIESIIEEVTSKDSKILYRVFLDDASKTPEQAREKRDNFYKTSFAQKNNLKGLWICKSTAPVAPVVSKTSETSETSVVSESSETTETSESSESSESSKNAEVSENVPQPLPSVNPNDIVLKKNETVSVSAEKPFSLLIKTYKEEQDAQIDKNRLVENDVDAYVLGKFDKDENFSFDLHAGAAQTEEELEPVVKQLEDLNVQNFEVTNYNDFAEKITNYDEIVKNQNVIFDYGVDTLPKNLSKDVLDCLNQFPINKDYKLKKVALCDLNNVNKIEKNEENSFYSEIDSAMTELDKLELPMDTKSISVFSLANYEDELLGKSLSVFIAITNDEVVEIKIDETVSVEEEKDFAIKYGTLHSYIIKKDENYVLKGTTEDKKLFIQMEMKNFSKEELDKFLENYYADSSLLIYPQIRKIFCVMPADENQEFLMYSLDNVGMDYVKNRGFADWAKKVYGHWRANQFFVQNNELVEISFFNLDYDYNAKDAHNLFMEEKKESSVDEKNHSQKINGIDGWYLSSSDSNELSFAAKSYIVSINSELTSSLKNDELAKVAESLKIWE